MAENATLPSSVNLIFPFNYLHIWNCRIKTLWWDTVPKPKLLLLNLREQKVTASPSSPQQNQIYLSFFCRKTCQHVISNLFCFHLIEYSIDPEACAACFVLGPSGAPEGRWQQAVVSMVASVFPVSHFIVSADKPALCVQADGVRNHSWRSRHQYQPWINSLFAKFMLLPLQPSSASWWRHFWIVQLWQQKLLHRLALFPAAAGGGAARGTGARRVDLRPSVPRCQWRRWWPTAAGASAPSFSVAASNGHRYVLSGDQGGFRPGCTRRWLQEVLHL